MEGLKLAARKLERPPTHPGAILRNDVLPAIDMPITKIAKALGVSRQQFHRILAETMPVSVDMALRLGKFFGNGPDLWLRMQTTWDLWHARRDLGDELARIPTPKAKEADHIPA
jgi:antitoxin HigA-1